MSPVAPSANRASIRNHLLAGICGFFVLGAVAGGWAVTTEISGAVMAPGSIVVDSNAKSVQHPTGGVVGALLVRDGDRVKAGDTLVRLDATLTQANLAIVSKSLDHFIARKARLTGESENPPDLRFPESLLERQHEPNVAAILEAERKLFEARSSARSGKKLQLTKRIDQLGEEIRGLTARSDAKRKELELIGRELVSVRTLWNKQLIEINRLIALEREQATSEGDLAQTATMIAQAHGKIAETELQILQIDQDLASDVASETREIDARIGEYVERRIAAEDQLKRIEIKAPQDGVVHQLTVHTVGGVVPVGERLMLIVPDSDQLVIEAKVQPQDVDQLSLDQAATLRFSAFSQRTTPEIDGTVSRISADVSTDPKTGASYYTVRIAIPTAEIARLGAVKLVPGMPVEAFIKTGDRSVASYFAKPLLDHARRAFRES